MSNALHHRHIRKRLYRKFERYPSTSALRRFFDYLVYIVALFTPLVLVPQVIQLFATKDVGGFSLPSWFLFGLIGIIWATYGIIHREWPIILSNTIMAFLDFVVVVGILIYR